MVGNGESVVRVAFFTSLDGRALPLLMVLLSLLGRNQERKDGKHNEQDWVARRKLGTETSEQGDGMLEHPFAAVKRKTHRSKPNPDIEQSGRR